MKTKLLTLIAVLLAGISAQAQSITFDPAYPNFNGAINATALDSVNGILYVGGAFTNAGYEVVLRGTSLDATTALPDLNFVSPNAPITVAVPDGSGGWYIGGGFTQVDGQARNRIARINADGSLHAWNPNANNNVTALAVSGSTVYAGGTFTTIGGTTRNYIAALDATTGNATAWNPAPDAFIRTLAVSGSTVYAAGNFTTIGGTTRNHIAALDAATGNATAWNPNANVWVNALAVSGNIVYAGGDFSIIGGQIRTRIAALDATTGNATAWNPGANGFVLMLAVSGNTVYAGGQFTTIGGQSRNRIAALDATINTNNATAWNPNPNNVVNTIAVSGSAVYVGGTFTIIDGQARNRIAALDATTGNATAWNPNANNSITAIAVSGSTVYAGGQFTTIGGQSRNRIAAIDIATKTLTEWNPDANNTVNALALSGNTLYAGGEFTNIGGQSRNRIAALDATVNTNNATAWNPNADGIVRTLVVSGSTVYAGGEFTNAGGQSRNRIAALDATTGTATAWNPNADGIVRTLAISGSTVYAGGNFNSIGGQSRNRIAALDVTTGNATAWNPNASDIVYALAVSGSTVYAGGRFTTMAGQTRSCIAALDATTGNATAWNPAIGNTVFALALSGNTVYAGGVFITVGGQARSGIAALDATVNTNNASAWNPGADNTVSALVVSGNRVYAGGQFINIEGQTKHRFAVFNLLTHTWTGGTSTAWATGSNWNTGAAPTATDDAIIPDVTNKPIISTTAAVKSITIESGATLTINANASLTTNRVLTNNSTVTVKSGGSLVQKSSSTLAGSGTYNIERSIPGGVSFISSPINNETANGFGITATGSNGGQVKPSPTNPCNPDSVAHNSPNGNLLEIRENATVLNNCVQSLWHVKSSGSLQNGRGYALNNPAKTLVFSGTVNNGTVTYTGLTRQSGNILDSDGSNPTMGWHLVGNPYPSPITLLGSDLTALGFDGQIQRYNAGAWVSNDPLVPVTIAVGQGFQIRKTSVGGTADFKLINAFRTADNPTFYKTEPREHYLNITLANGTYTDNTMVYFMDDATDNFDAAYDANRFVDGGNTPMLYTLAGNERLSYNALPTINAGETKTVSLSTRTSIDENYTLTFNDFATLNATVMLEDLKLNTTQPVTEGFTYNFTTATGDSRDRFLLHFEANSTTGISSLSTGKGAGVRLFPNPTSGTVSLMFTEQHSYEQATITDISGKTIQTYTLNEQTNHHLNTTDLPKGIYFIHLKGSSNQTLKLIKQ